MRQITCVLCEIKLPTDSAKVIPLISLRQCVLRGRLPELYNPFIFLTSTTNYFAALSVPSDGSPRVATLERGPRESWRR